MKLCPTCKNKYGDDANFCPREECAGEQGPQRLLPIVEQQPASRFVPISRLGGGASGEVWQASDAQSQAAVAYKVVAPEVLPTTVMFERAQRELRQLQRANSPRIVKVIDFGKTPEGRLFIASELASGEPLDQVVEQGGPMPLDRAKRIAAQIGEALLEAQKVGVVHRDLAAKNILVSGDDEVRVINFGIPRPLSEHVFGVPEYLSPEQAEGKLVDQRSNTYSLGALLYLMLTGHPPHTAATAEATIAAVLKAEITPPSIRRGEGLTAEVDRTILKALERNSSRRPLTMRQFLNDVAGLIVTDQSVAAAAAGAARDAGFARTMMFAGGATEVQKLVAQAVAARQAADNGAPLDAALPDGASQAAPAPGAARAATSPSLSAAAPTGTPSPVATAGGAGSSTGATPSPVAHRPSHGAAIAATMMAMPAARLPGGGGGGLPGGTPAPSSVARPSPTNTPPLAAAGAPGSDAANFRETLWFKKGDVDQMVADARAKIAAIADANASASASASAATASVAAAPDSMQATGSVILGGELPSEEAKPLEERYVDDGTVTVDDRKKFSLGSGSGRTSSKMRGGSVPGERMSETEMLEEIGGGKRMMIIGIAAAVVVALIAVIALAVKGKSSPPKADDKAATAPASQAAPPPAPPPAPAATGAQAPDKPAEAKPATGQVTPPPAAVKAVTAKPQDDRPAAPAKPAAAKKHVVVKKKPPPIVKKKR